MEREHLYRGKRVDNGEWVEGCLLQICGGTVIYHGSKTESDLGGNERECIMLYDSEVSVVYPETVGQFTGLYDTTKWAEANEFEKKYAYELAKKNGTNAETEWRGIRIFEWDIVKYYQPYAKRTDIHIVKYDTMFASFCLFEKDNKWAKESDWMKIQDVKVIGNIHDNPDLI